jgi:hypothetical protein
MHVAQFASQRGAQHCTLIGRKEERAREIGAFKNTFRTFHRARQRPAVAFIASALYAFSPRLSDLICLLMGTHTHVRALTLH